MKPTYHLKVIEKLKKHKKSSDPNPFLKHKSGDFDEIEMPVVRNETEQRAPLIRIQDPINPNVLNLNNQANANRNNNDDNYNPFDHFGLLNEPVRPRMQEPELRDLRHYF